MGEALKLFNKGIKKLELKTDINKYIKKKDRSNKSFVSNKETIATTYREVLKKFKEEMPKLIEQAEKNINAINESTGVQSTILQEVNMFQTKTKKIINKFDKKTVKLIKEVHKNFKDLISSSYGLATMKTLRNKVDKALDKFSETKKLYIEKNTECKDVNELPIKKDKWDENQINYMNQLAKSNTLTITITESQLKATDAEIQGMLSEIQGIKSEKAFPKEKYEKWMQQGGETVEQKIINSYKVIRLFNLYFDQNAKFIFDSDIAKKEGRKQKAKKALKFGLAAPFVAILVCILSPLILIIMLKYASQVAQEKQRSRMRR